MVLQTAAGSGLQRATTRSPLDWNPSYLTHLEITEIMKFLCSWASHFPVRNFGGLLQVHLPELDRQTPFPDQQGENLLSRSGRGHQVLTSKPFEWSSLKQTEDASLCKCHVMSCVFLNTFLQSEHMEGTPSDQKRRPGEVKVFASEDPGQSANFLKSQQAFASLQSSKKYASEDIWLRMFEAFAQGLQPCVSQLSALVSQLMESPSFAIEQAN